MTSEQIHFINEQLRFMGFAEYTPEQLAVFTGLPEFELTQSRQIDGDHTESILYFRYSGTYAIHFFNRHHLTVKDREQVFYPDGGKGITFKQGYNLLSGRAVFKKFTTKEGQEYFAWMQLNFRKKEATGYAIKKYYENYGFQIAGALDQIGLTPYNNWDRAGLIRSLERGNLQAVLLESGKAWIAANPGARKIDVFDTNVPANEIPTVSPAKRKRTPTK